jgi:hypothetical protein
VDLDSDRKLCGKMIGGAEGGWTFALEDPVSTSILDERVVVLVHFLRSGVAPRSASVVGLWSWKEGSCSKKVPLACPRAQKIPSCISAWLSTLATDGIMFVVGSCSDRTVGISSKNDEVTWLSGVQSLIKMTMTFITQHVASVLLNGTPMNEVRSKTLAIFIWNLSASSCNS